MFSRPMKDIFAASQVHFLIELSFWFTFCNWLSNNRPVELHNASKNKDFTWSLLNFIILRRFRLQPITNYHNIWPDSAIFVRWLTIDHLSVGDHSMIFSSPFFGLTLPLSPWKCPSKHNFDSLMFDRLMRPNSSRGLHLIVIVAKRELVLVISLYVEMQK